jgi:hypothetical protein
MTDWIALSDRTEPLDAPGGLLASGTFVLEFAVPLSGPAVLLDFHASAGWARAFSVFADPATGLRILHRQGERSVRHVVQGALPTTAATARLTLSWHGPARSWTLRLEYPGTGLAGLSASGTDPLPLPMADIAALCDGGPQVHRSQAVLWFGLSHGDTLPARAPWVGQRTPIATPAGLVAAANLRPGDLVLTRDDGPRPLAFARRITLPARGSFAPVLLRAPYFGAAGDMLVSADQKILLGGGEVEYLFGEEEVLAEARHLAEGHSAMQDTRRSVAVGVVLGLHEPGLIRTEGCAFASLPEGPLTPDMPRRLLHGYEVAPLLALLGRGLAGRVA